MNSDASFIAAALAGDSAAFGQLVGLYQDRLYNALVRVLGSPEDARDLTQDAFVQAFRKLDSFRGQSAFYTWLYRIAFNLAMSHARRARKMVSLECVQRDWGGEPQDGHAAPDTAVQQRELVALVQAGLAELSIDFRQILVLREIEGCSYEQIAEILEMPIGTVRSRLFRARLQLRDHLAPRLRAEKTADTR